MLIYKYKVWDNEKRRMSKVIDLFSPLISWEDGDMDMPTDFAINNPRFVFLQYTNCLDKNNKEIYLDDIVLVPHRFEDDCEKKAEVGIVDFEDGQFFIKLKNDYYFHWENVEVLYNSHEEPI